MKRDGVCDAALYRWAAIDRCRIGMRVRRLTVVTVGRQQCVGFGIGIDRLPADFGARERRQRGRCESQRAERQGRCLLLTYMDPAIDGIGGFDQQHIQSDAQVMRAFTARFSSRLLGPS
ncbi:hypothetical protein [Burkholderia cepacia]|uniref:Uncharacterized protein n=1 Tax=Burkholderia cepacia TaxID=292 RepID=A0A8I1DP48_BURCE|nr:hypothetical protein [Burkholderia cepacia]MBA9901649.1 hypothetical protein [Burkholderia cepacia]MBA9948574.1 hypothetical protein [Burkholderia cepacia]MBA9978867.1 hypothetical protein [Burkholderia cepacia]MBA9997541.1 hypothetical protein [Burkholderia cepacia]MBB0005552.1 hypothetical protein [Burkholderia cepacia]